MRTDLTPIEIKMLNDKLRYLLGYYGLETVTETLSEVVKEYGKSWDAITEVCERDAKILMSAVNEIKKPLKA